MVAQQGVCEACGELHHNCICNDYEPDCHHCGGEGWVDGTEEDPWWHGWNHPMIDCPCCGGSGNAKDCCFW